MSGLFTHHPLPAHTYRHFSERDRMQCARPDIYETTGAPIADDAHIEAGMRHYDIHFDGERRSLLTSVIRRQLPEAMTGHDILSARLGHLAAPNGYAVVTAHQPCLMTGPLYVVYKVASAIALARRLESRYPTRRFVPVYVLGSEDHDLDEMNHLHLFGKKVTWEGDKTGGAVGRMPLGPAIDDVLTQIDEKLAREANHAWLMELLRASYRPEYTMAQAITQFIYGLFADKGLLVLDPDDRTLKASAATIFEEELHHQPSESLVQSTQSVIASMGLKPQVYARPINLFYIGTKRGYMTSEHGRIKADDVEMMIDDLLLHPERLSPNVILRPIYQQHILPAVAFVGGGAEVAYWAELSDVFKHYGVWYPAVYRRDSAAMLSSRHHQKWLDADLSIDEMARPFNEIETDYLETHTDISWHYDKEVEALQKIYQQIKDRAIKVDKGLDKQVDRYAHAAEKEIRHLEQRLRKHIKQQKEVELNRLRRIHDHLHPSGKPQERYDSPLQYLARYGAEFISELIHHFDPTEPNMRILIEP